MSDIPLRTGQECRIRMLEEVANAAKTVFNWYFIFGEDNDAAREHLAHLGNALKAARLINTGEMK